jgi:hypothetical protein
MIVAAILFLENQIRLFIWFRNLMVDNADSYLASIIYMVVKRNPIMRC